MVKKRLTSNLIAEKIVLTIVLIITIFLWVAIPEIPLIFILLILIFVGYNVYTMYFVVNNISYDELDMFIKNGKQEKVVELKQVSQIKLTPYYGSWRNKWKIKYILNDKEEHVFFFSKYGLISLKPFVKIVKAQNPSVDCVYFTLGFDFD